ncbi:unnamed protein product [Phytophthora fragariaefolia]|uniref:Unnamed protein product n=1 Tax=Phytophthora fragariaefolia TaxID=1490495 RepID=A0A9W7CTZ2_9STRA|nr:unnamed protein product [Phytophthora fragariaefolia]
MNGATRTPKRHVHQGWFRIVDAWKASEETNFYRFCSNNGHVHLVGASPTGMCAVYAISIAAKLLGITGWNSSSVVEDFISNCASRGRPISPSGLTYGELRHYVKFVNGRNTTGGQISMSTLDQNLLGGVNGKLAGQRLRVIHLSEGGYICAAFNSMGVSHCIAIRVACGEKYFHDEENDSVALVTYDFDWIYGISFLRRVALHLTLSDCLYSDAIASLIIIFLL